MKVVAIFGAGFDPTAIMRETWGHLDARPGVEHPGQIVFAEGAFGGERIVLSVDFGDAGDVPWFYAGIHEWLLDQDAEPGSIYRFDGVYRLAADGANEFVGEVRKVADVLALGAVDG